MTFFKDIIAQSYLQHTQDGNNKIAQFYFQEFYKERDGSDGEPNYSRNKFYSLLLANIDDLINDTYDRAKKYSNRNPQSIEDMEFYGEERHLRVLEKMDMERISYQQAHTLLFGHEKIRLNYLNASTNAKELREEMNNDRIVLKDPIIIINPPDTISIKEVVLRKSKLVFLKAEAKRAQLANSIDELDEMLDNSNGNTEIKNEENANSSIISNESLSSKEKAIKDSIDSAYLIIKPLGGMLVAEDLLSHEDMQRLINYIESIVRDELLQENLPLFPKIPLSNMFIRKTIHEVYLFLGKKNKDQFIKLTHLFEQFDGTETTTTSSKFSSYSGIYKDYLMKISY